MYSVLPATSSRLSRLPAWRPGGTLETRPASGAGAPHRLGGGCHAEAAVERPQRNDDARLELGGHLLAIQRQDLDRQIALAVLGQIAVAAVVAVVEREIDRQDLDLEDVTRLGVLDVD